jgi:ABC-2 type transport system permease protein
MKLMVDKIRKHTRVIGRLWRISIQKNLAFRWQFLSQLINNAISVGFSIMIFEIAYAHTSTIGGWSKYQTILLVGVFQLYSVLLGIFFSPNVGRMTDVIYHGELDGLLLKPLSAQVIISLRDINVPSAINGILGLFVVVYALIHLHIVPTLLGILLAIIMLFSGLIIVYSLWFISMTLEFWFSGLWSWSNFIPNIFDFAKYPQEFSYAGAYRRFGLAECAL